MTSANANSICYYDSSNLLHRLDGPAVIRADGETLWYYHGLLNRDDGPAVEYATGTKVWYVNSKRHREDGPAFEGHDGVRTWWLAGEQLTEEEHARITAPATAFNPTTKFTIPIVLSGNQLQYLAEIGGYKFTGSDDDLIALMNDCNRMHQLGKLVTDAFTDSMDASDGERESNFFSEAFGPAVVKIPNPY